MFGYRRHSFDRAAELLSALRHNPNDRQQLFLLQTLLVSEILLAEDRIRQYRTIAGRDATEGSQYYRSRLPSLRRSIYYWKMFGDAIAFLYLDRFALKHVFYNTKNTNPRQDGGFIGGSAGFSHELRAMNMIADLGAPCVLTDITNTIRYGDICLLTGADPLIIEVKASSTKDRRRTKQRRNMQTLSEFYRNDESHGFRGFPNVRRIPTPECESHDAAFNRCIYEAYGNGASIISPEQGVEYIAITDPRTTAIDIVDQSTANEPWLFYLNDWKTDQAWAPYYPPTLLIETKSALYDFLLGRLHLVVLLDTAVMRQRAVEMGYTLSIVQNHEYPLRARQNGSDDEVNISKHLMLRAALEAVSVKWIIETTIGATQRHFAPPHRECDRTVQPD